METVGIVFARWFGLPRVGAEARGPALPRGPFERLALLGFRVFGCSEVLQGFHPALRACYTYIYIYLSLSLSLSLSLPLSLSISLY